MSYLAGFSGYPFWRFLVFDIAGEIVSAVAILGLGYTFGASWPEVWVELDGLPGIVVLGTVGAVLLLVGLKVLVDRPAPVGSLDQEM